MRKKLALSLLTALILLPIQGKAGVYSVYDVPELRNVKVIPNLGQDCRDLMNGESTLLSAEAASTITRHRLDNGEYVTEKEYVGESQAAHDAASFKFLTENFPPQNYIWVREIRVANATLDPERPRVLKIENVFGESVVDYYNRLGYLQRQAFKVFYNKQLEMIHAYLKPLLTVKLLSEYTINQKFKEDIIGEIKDGILGESFGSELNGYYLYFKGTNPQGEHFHISIHIRPRNIIIDTEGKFVIIDPS